MYLCIVFSKFFETIKNTSYFLKSKGNLRTSSTFPIKILNECHILLRAYSRVALISKSHFRCGTYSNKYGNPKQTKIGFKPL